MFNRIAVEFVPEGVTAEEARRAREQQRKTLSKRDAVVALLAVAALVGILAIPAWKFWPRQTIPPTPAPPVVAAAPAILPASTPIAPTPAALPSPSIISPTNTLPPPTPMAVVTVTTVSKFSTMAKSLFSSPVATVAPVTAVITQAVVHTHPQTITAPPPPLTPTYRVLLNAVHAESNPGASYHISGWVVERDGRTPRPVKMALDFPTGSMSYPRPGMTDVANGFYEFLVEPGDYTLRIVGDEPFALPVVISPTGPARYEISIRYNGKRPIAAAYSSPWDSGRAPHPSATSSPVAQPTPTPKSHTIYLPLILQQIAVGEYKSYLPLVSKPGVLTGSLQIQYLVNY